jgi:hypothetical protein
MGIKDFYVPKKKVEFDGKLVCEVRGITPDDIARIVSQNAKDMDKLVEMFAKDKAFAKINPADAASLASVVDDNSSAMFGQVILQVPDLVARLIAVASDEDDAETIEHIKKNLPILIQFDAVVAIAEATFINKDVFKDFVGKVMALVGNGGGQRLKAVPSRRAGTG